MNLILIVLRAPNVEKVSIFPNNLSNTRLRSLARNYVDLVHSLLFGAKKSSYATTNFRQEINGRMVELICKLRIFALALLAITDGKGVIMSDKDYGNNELAE